MTSRPSQRRARTSVSNWTNVNACPRWVVSYGVTPHTYSLMVPSGSGFRVADRVSLRNTGTRADVSLQPASQPTARSGRESQTYGPDQRQRRASLSSGWLRHDVPTDPIASRDAVQVAQRLARPPSVVEIPSSRDRSRLASAISTPGRRWLIADCHNYAAGGMGSYNLCHVDVPRG